MIIEILSSIKENLKSRVTTPFLGTFSIVYIIHNWRLFYSLIYFDSRLNSDERISKINEFFSSEGFIWNLIICVGITFVVLILTYLFKAISQYLTNIYKFQVIPYTHKWTDKGKIVLKTTYDSAIEQRDKAVIRFNKERDDRNSLILEKEKIEEEIAKLKATNITPDEANKLREVNDSLLKQLEAKDVEMKDINLKQNDLMNANAYLSEQLDTKDKEIKNVNLKQNVQIKHLKDENETLMNQYDSKLEEYKIIQGNYEKEIKALLEGNSELKSQVELKTNEIQILSEQLNKKMNYLNGDKESVRILANKPESLAKVLYDLIVRKNFVNELDTFFIYSNTGRRVAYDNLLKDKLVFFVTNNILNHSAISNMDGKVEIKFTPLGHEIYSLRLLDKFKNTKIGEEIYKEIVKRFPEGKLAEYLLGKENIEINRVILFLEEIAIGMDAEKIYADSQSKNDAQEFIKRFGTIDLKK